MFERGGFRFCPEAAVRIASRHRLSRLASGPWLEAARCWECAEGCIYTRSRISL